MDRALNVADQPDGQPPTNLLGHYAGFISRLIAFFIDTTIISVIIVVSTWLLRTTFDMLQGNLFLDVLINNFPGIQLVINAVSHPLTAGVLIWLFMTSYHVLLWYFAGQTIGKSLIGLRVVPLKGGRVQIWRGILRYLGYYPSALCLGLGFLWIILDKRRMGWHDKIARTCVIYTWEARPDERFLIYAMRMLKSRREAVNEIRAQQKRLKQVIRKQRISEPGDHTSE
jgi:uncharacterized RDD family membrane protein YckC